MPARAAILLEQCLEREKTLDDALGEVPALDAKPEAYVAADAVARAHRIARSLDVRQSREPARRPFDGNRVGHHAAHAATECHGHVLVIDLAFEEPIDRREEILAVISRVKAENIGGQHVREYLLLPWTDAERLGIRPRNVPEQRDRRRGLALTQQRGSSAK